MGLNYSSSKYPTGLDIICDKLDEGRKHIQHLYTTTNVFCSLMVLVYSTSAVRKFFLCDIVLCNLVGSRDEIVVELITSQQAEIILYSILPLLGKRFHSELFRLILIMGDAVVFLFLKHPFSYFFSYPSY